MILENIDIDIDIDKAILQNIDIDKISNRFKFGISNRATTGQQERAQGDGEDQEIIDSAVSANSRHVNFLNLEAYFIFVYDKC